MSDRLLCTWQHVTLIFNETRLSQVLHYQLYANVDKTRGADRYCWLLKLAVSEDKLSNTWRTNGKIKCSATLSIDNGH
jgi:hypothetical protein